MLDLVSMQLFITVDIRLYPATSRDQRCRWAGPRQHKRPARRRRGNAEDHVCALSAHGRLARAPQ